MTYSVEEIEKIAAETENANPHVLHIYDIIRQLLAERKEIRRQAFEEAAEIALKHSGLCFGSMYSRQISEKLRRKAEEEIGNSGRVDDNDPDDISG